MTLDALNLSEDKLKQLQRKGFETVEDILYFFPRKYWDFREYKTVNEVTDGDKCAMKLFVQSITKYTSSKVPYIVALCMDQESQTTVKVIWFNQPYIYRDIKDYEETTVIVAGTFSYSKRGIAQFVNPIKMTSNNINEIYPVYSKIAGMSDEYFRQVIRKCLDICPISDQLSDDIKTKFNIISEGDMISKFHTCKTVEELTAAKKRLIFDNVYEYAMQLNEDKKKLCVQSCFIPKFLTNCNKFISGLPYELTKDQKSVVTQFISTARSGTRVNALIQGDVGSGKTVCAFILMIAMSDNGYQSALMAPTGVLARQHYNELASYVEPLGLNVVYLANDLKAKDKRAALAKIKSGEANFVVGTHSVISDSVEFRRLGLTIVDEEHKFGVVQRRGLEKKAEEGVHSITMSATPIPRSLAMAVYGGALDIYNISTMPNGRKPVLTEIVSNEQSSLRFMLTQLNKGKQCYIVCPLITAGEKADLKEDGVELPITVEEEYETVNNFFEPYGYKVGVVTGKMKDDEKSEVIESFSRGDTHILIATTIIEVGVNVPNATVIAIENAERYGLAGLHQLRGRVGRGNLQSYCMLRSTNVDNPKLKIMCETCDGFKIAEEDLKLRGTGDISGTRQSGKDSRLPYVLKYPKLFGAIKDEISN